MAIGYDQKIKGVLKIVVLLVITALSFSLHARSFSKAEISAFEQQLKAYEASYDPTNDPCAIYYAVNTGNQDLVKYAVVEARKAGLLAQKINCTGNATPTPLVIAVQRGDIDSARFLLRSGADVNSVGEAENPPLYHAIQNDDIPMMKLLLDNGASKDLYAGDIPANILSPEKDLSMTAVMAHGDDKQVSRDLLEKSVTTRNVESTERLLEMGVDPNTSLTDDEINALMELSGSLREQESDAKNARITRSLIKHGADVKATEAEKNTSLLMGPVQKDFVEMARTLLEEGADPNKRVPVTSETATAYNLDSQYRQRSVMPQPTPATTSPLEEAEKIGDKEMLELLRQYQQ